MKEKKQITEFKTFMLVTVHVSKDYLAIALLIIYSESCFCIIDCALDH